MDKFVSVTHLILIEKVRNDLFLSTGGSSGVYIVRT